MFGRQKNKSRERNWLVFFLSAIFIIIFLADVYLVALLFFRNRASFLNSASQPTDISESQKASSTLIDSNSSIIPVSVETVISRLDQELGLSNQPKQPDSVLSNSAPLYLGAFGYSVSNVDGDKTNLYFDDTAKGIMFPLDYKWQAADNGLILKEKEKFSGVNYNDFSGPYNDIRCLSRNCLKQKGSDLYYDGKILNLPAGIKKSDIAAVSIGALSRRWLVGYTLKDGQKYSGAVFYFDGRNFSKINFPAISSSYFGLFGFGGEESDFIVLYGAYDGLAYRVRNNNFTDLTKFFNIRTMNGGFKAEIIKTAYRYNINWYIYSATAGRPRLIKLWQNHSTEIAGVAVFTDIFSGTEPGTSFKVLETTSDKVKLLAEVIGAGGEESWKIFTDYGFKNNLPGYLTTVPISNLGNGSGVIIKNLVSSDLAVDAGSASTVKFLFSTDGANWQDVPSGQNINFVTQKIKYYYLKLTFPASTDKFYSPYVGNISFDYECEKL